MGETISGRSLRVLGILASAVAICLVVNADSLAGENDATKLYLVGVGPGDPDLITLRAVRTIREADLVFCSQGLDEKFAAHLEGKDLADAPWWLFHYYGKVPAEFQGEERRRCEEVAQRRNQFTTKVRHAIKEGKTVAILDSGDPLIYGPWAWCLEEFEDLSPVVVPGLSCFNAANAALRRGITWSERTKSVILTMMDLPGKTDTIDKLSVQQTTMVVFTMKSQFKEFIEKLSINYPPETPVAIVKHAGYASKEEVIQGTLGTIRDQIDDQKLPFEYLIYVGDFLTHRYNKLNKVQQQ